MANRVIRIEDLDKEIADQLKKYNANVVKGVKEATSKRIEQLVRETKATAPKSKRKHKHYNSYITSRKVFENEQGVEYEWYVKAPVYRLSHLLENGHVTRNGGRTRAFSFIRNATDHVLDAYLKDVEEVLQNVND